MSWQANLKLDLVRAGERTNANFLHDGPLRILKSQHPEGPSICHNVIVHPPSGVVGGDSLNMHIHARDGAHGVICTPGATRFYRSDGPLAKQLVHLKLGADARLEWLPMESMAYSGCRALSQLDLDLAPGAGFMGWDVLALGLPHAGRPFLEGHFESCWRWGRQWLERGVIRASDSLLLDSPLGLAGRRCLGTLVLAEGGALSRSRRDLAQDAAREACAGLAATLGNRIAVGVTSPQTRLVVVRALADQTEPVMTLFRAIWAAWRPALWDVKASVPRIWAV